MYKNILKKDIKRKKTMNVILLIFITLAVMFVSSSANNLMAVTNALDNFMKISNVPDYFVLTKGEAQTGKNTTDLIKDLDCVKSYRTNDCIYTPLEVVKYKGKKVDMQNQGIMVPFDKVPLNYFDSNNNQITEVNKGEIYLKNSLMNNNDIKIGDKITLNIDNVSVEFTVKGSIKDAIFGSEMMGNYVFVLNKSDYNKFEKADSFEMRQGKMIYIDTTDTESVETALSDDPTIVFCDGRDLLKTSYIMDMIIAGMLLAVSVFLIVIAFVILRFTISFTLSEEYREIGIMKAIGIRNRKIRGLYMVKYFAMSVVGSTIGFLCGIPFGNMLLMQASENIVITSENNVLINTVCSLAVVIVVMLFCYSCTRKVKKFTPVDAIRNGQTGERFKKKSIIKLHKSHFRPVPFMAVNDILSGLKRFSIVAVSFFIGILMITIPLNTMTTLKSDKLVSWFSMKQSDVYLRDKKMEDKYICSNGHEKIKDNLKSMEDKLAENGIKAKCGMESIFRFTVEKGDCKIKSLAFQGVGTKAKDYAYLEGTAPKYKNEVAITYVNADKLHAKIGDTVTITTINGSDDYIITAIYQSMNNMGEGIRLNEKVELDYTQSFGFFAYQINYTDNPSEQVMTERMETIKDLFPKYDVYTGGEYVDYMDGGIVGYMSSSVYLILAIVIIINILVAVLMAKSFFTKEKGEIAMMKAVGFSNGAIILKQTLRMAIVMIIATIVAVLLADPVGHFAVGGIFQMMGAKTIIFDVNILQTYIIYPVIVLVCTILSVFIVSQQVRKVSSSEINSIE